jgi:predicted RNase H-like HicB family nuclease
VATPLIATIVRDDGVWLAWVEGTPGAHAWGRSIAQALTRLDIALDLLDVEEPIDTRIELAPALRTTVGAARSARQRADHASR